MRLIIILLVLLAIGLLIRQQLDRETPAESEQVEETSGAGTPAVPQNPEDLKEFKDQLNSFIKDSKTERDRRMDEALDQGDPREGRQE
jgi:hypothetical protein